MLIGIYGVGAADDSYQRRNRPPDRGCRVAGNSKRETTSWILSTGKCSKSKGSRTFTLTASALFHSEGQVNNVCALDGILIAKLGCLNLEITGVLLVDQSSYRKFKILNSAYWVIFQI